ncbi:MAG: hypothetical protein IJK70_05965 [Bacteroidales bacterium]|nr:hypothetical protein [Bacteroidales bacterium]
MSVSRRVVLLLCVLAAAAGLFSCSGGNSEVEDLYSAFSNPAMSDRPFVRWWWNGAKLSAEEIDRELNVMKEAGIGGVEINTIRFPGGDDLGIPSMDYMSPEWIEMVKSAIESASKLGMTCDIIVGSGWPFGAEFLSENERTQLLTKTSRPVSGPSKVTVDVAELLSEAYPQVASKYEGQTASLYSLVLAPRSMPTFTPGIDIPFEKNATTVTVDVPAGDYILYALVKVTGFQSVINGGPGASGPVLNHYDKNATLHFLHKMSDNLFPAIKGTDGFRALFCDSMELEGANWCDDFLEEFKRRRGYDIAPYLPFILYKVGHMGHAVEGAVETRLSQAASEEISRTRYDYFTCCMDMMKDRFLTTFDSWCDSAGFKSRVQAYGREFHPVDASMVVDIPECETWFWNPDGCDQDAFIKRPTYTNVNKSVASAVHFKGGHLVSCEEITNTNNVFNASLEKIKMTGDQSNLSGVTHSILHGFNYSPSEAPFPGWVQYGTYLNEKNTIWPYFRLWADYKARISAVLTRSDFYADIALMMPWGDLWTKKGPQRDPFPALHYPEYADEVWAAIHRNGNSCDYVSESILQGSSSKRGKLVIGGREYPVLMLLEVESMMPQTAEAVRRFVSSGGKLLLVGKIPFQSVGLYNHADNDAKVKSVFSEILASYPDRVYKVDAPKGEITDWFRNIQDRCGIEPYVEIDKPTPYISQIKHVAGDTDIYFFVNSDPKEGHVLNVRFHSAGIPMLWDPETGWRMKLDINEDGTIRLPIERAGSRLIVFEHLYSKPKASEASLVSTPPMDPGYTATRPDFQVDPVSVRSWDIRFDKVDGTSFELKDSPLFDLSKDSRTVDFAGVVTYSAEVPVTPGKTRLIDLGEVYGVSEVYINGVKVGLDWYGGRVSGVPAKLLDGGKALITVKVTTTLGNYMKSLKDNPMAQRWTSYQSVQPAGMLGPVFF